MEYKMENRGGEKTIKCWTYEEGKALINVYKNRRDEWHYTPNKYTFWENCLSDLENLNVLVSPTTVVHVMNKWKTLLRAYRSCLNKSIDINDSRFVYLKEMDELFQDKKMKQWSIPKQIEILKSFMKERPEFANDRLPKKKMDILWDILTYKLNDAGPTKRDTSHWKKLWNDLKYNDEKHGTQQSNQSKTKKRKLSYSDNSDSENVDSKHLNQSITDIEDEENGSQDEMYVEEITFEPNTEKYHFTREDDDSEESGFVKQKISSDSKTKNELFPDYVNAIVENTKIQCEILKSLQESNALKKQELEIQKEELEIRKKEYELNKKRYELED